MNGEKSLPKSSTARNGRRLFPAGGKLFPQPDYPLYRLSRKETVLLALGGALAGLIVGLLFYRGPLALAPVLPGAYILYRAGGQRKLRSRKRLLTAQLKDYLVSVTGFLRIGYALENAMIGAEREMTVMHGPASPIAGEAGSMSRAIRLNTPPEELWRDFACRCGLPDGLELARVIAVAKHQGGDYLPVLRAMAAAMDARRLVREEIETLLEGQKLEYRIMCLIPAFILLYLGISAPELTAGLYTGGGPLFMTGMLLLYLFACLAGSRILEKSYEG